MSLAIFDDVKRGFLKSLTPFISAHPIANYGYKYSGFLLNPWFERGMIDTELTVR